MKSLFASLVAGVLWCVVSFSVYAQQQLASPEAARDLAERVIHFGLMTILAHSFSELTCQL
jgi:hypothetical protein